MCTKRMSALVNKCGYKYSVVLNITNGDEDKLQVCGVLFACVSNVYPVGTVL